MRRNSDHNELFREVFDHAFDAILMLDPTHGRVLDANHRARQMLGYERHDLESLSLSEILDEPEDVFAHRPEQSWIGPLTFRTRNGGAVRTETSVSRVDATGGAYLILAARDSGRAPPSAVKTSSRRLSELRRVARISTVSELAASLANEINQPLTAIMLNAKVVERSAGDETLPSTLRETLADIAQDSRRAGDTVWNLRRLLQGEDLERRSLDVSDVIRDIADLLHEDTGREHVTLVLELASELPSILGDPLYLQLVIRNLARNAIEVMRDGPEEPRTLTIETKAEQGEVRTSVRDRGLGLAPQTRERMFEPFFTTRPGQPGLGLAICRSIIEAHGGRLWAEPNPGGGSVVRFTLPPESTHDAPDRREMT